LLVGSEADFRLRKVSNNIYYFVILAVAWLTSETHDWWAHYSIYQFLGLVLTTLAFAVRACATGYLPQHIIMDTKLRAPRLVVTGPFDVVRNPLYLGTFCILFSSALLFNLTTAIVGFLYCLVRMARFVSYDEEQLATKFGEQYQAYQNRVPRLFPTSLPKFIQMFFEKNDWMVGIKGSLWILPQTLYFFLSFLNIIPRTPYLLMPFLTLSLFVAFFI